MSQREIEAVFTHAQLSPIERGAEEVLRAKQQMLWPVSGDGAERIRGLRIVVSNGTGQPLIVEQRNAELERRSR